MKKTLVMQAAIVLALQPLSTFCQATIIFENSATTLIKQPDSPSSPSLHGLLGYVQLAYAPAGTPLSPPGVSPSDYDNWLSSNPGWRFADTTRVVGGLFNGGTIGLEGIPAGASISYSLFAWGPDETVYQSYNDWQYGSWGFGGPFTTATGGAGAAPVSLATSLTEIVLPRPAPIPEPSILSLTLMAAGLLLTVTTPRS